LSVVLQTKDVVERVWSSVWDKCLSESALFINSDRGTASRDEASPLNAGFRDPDSWCPAVRKINVIAHLPRETADETGDGQAREAESSSDAKVRIWGSPTCLADNCLRVYPA